MVEFRFFIHLLTLAVAGLLLWKSCRSLRGGWLGLIALAGFIVRALAGQATFWISYLQLPFARSLQMGDGLWFYGADGVLYTGVAEPTAARGLRAILFLSDTNPSVVYIKLLSFFYWLFGSHISTAILLNLFAYLATMHLIRSWLMRKEIDPDSRGPLVTTTAIAASPSLILWSTQALKDPLFLFLVVALVYAIQMLYLRVAREQTSSGVLLATAAALAVTTWAMAGIRWYVPLIVMPAVLLVLMLIIRGTNLRLLAKIGWFMLFVLVVTQGIFYGGGAYVPLHVQKTLQPHRMIQDLRNPVAENLAYLEVLRGGFESTPAATKIQLGETLDPDEEVQSAGTFASSPDRQVSAIDEPASPGEVSGTLEPVAGDIPATSLTVEPTRETSVAPGQGERISQPEQGTTRPARTRAPEQDGTNRKAPMTAEHNSMSPAERLIAGLLAFFIPRLLLQSLGLVVIEGGRGLWFFAELTTLWFIATCAAALLMFVRMHRSTAKGVSLMPWFLLLCAAALTLPIVYAVDNFGTLFRHREMVFAFVALIPLAAARGSRDPSHDPRVERASAE